MKTHKKIKLIIVLSICTLASILLFNFTKSVIIENHDEVLPNTELTYYLDIKYDGIDKYGNDSLLWNPSTWGDTTIDVKSDYIYVEDKIPNGLKFNGFVTTSNNTIGAVSQIDKEYTCLGNVIDDTESGIVYNEEGIITSYHGLHYDEFTRTVKFKVENLQSGCKVTVGIKTITPTINPGERLDFYNTAMAKEGAQTIYSNTVHAWMGLPNKETYKVNYKYIGDIPDNAPLPPKNNKYAEGTSVNVENNIDLEGYTFSGWTTEDATVTSGAFKMPDHEVTFVGSFTEIEKYTVSYQINGEKPNRYIKPNDKMYYPDSTVTLDTLNAGDIFNGYRFLGWESVDVEITKNNNFIMPNHDVVLEGKFESVKYKVEYKFKEDVLPPNYIELLPETKYYNAGEKITLTSLNDIEGYQFLGWYKEQEFTMPEQDITIYGEWRKVVGLFEPSIKIEITNPKPFYKDGNKVEYKLTITNNDNFTLKDLNIKNYNSNLKFYTGSNYKILSENLIRIEKIEANSSVELFAYYDVTNEKEEVITELELLGALAENDYELDASKEYKTKTSFYIASKLIITNDITNDKNEKMISYHIINENGYDTWITLNNQESTLIYVEPLQVYTIKEVIPQDYSLKEIIAKYNESSKDNEIKETESSQININTNIGITYDITFKNEYKKKGYFHSTGRVVNKIDPNIINDKLLYNVVKKRIYKKYRQCQ